MESKKASNKTEEKEQSKKINSNNQLKKIRSNFILKIFFGYINKRNSLEIIKYNKNIQKRINININHYKEYSEKYSSIEIEIILMENKFGQFINIKEEDKVYYHIYFNDNKKEEIKYTFLNKNEKVSKINIIIDYHITSLSYLFYYCKCIESINFKKFYRNNITDMSFMFYGCSSLKELNLNNFNANNVTNISSMFKECSDELKIKIKSKYKNFNKNAFYDSIFI